MRGAGGRVDGIGPPRLGMRGNPDLLRIDRTSDESAARARDRLAGQRPRP